MGEVNKIKTLNSSGGSYTEFYYHFFRNILIVALPLLVVSAIVLSSIRISATDSGSGTDSLTISISSACTLGSVVDIEHSTNTNVGTYTSDIGKTTIKTLCNDGNGYSVYAVGYSNNEEGNNKLINSERPEYSIDTGLNTSGLTSQWAMKLNNIPDDPSPTPPTIEADYNNVYGIVPPYWTKVAGRASGTTDMDEGSSFTTTYAVYASSNQHAGTYNGQVKYVLTHPSAQPYVYYMQEVDKWKNALALEESVQAIDMRDGKKYWVTKLKDGNIWMTQNLDFNIDTTRTYTHNDTDLGWDPNNFDTNATWTPDTTNGKYNLPVNGTSVPGWSNQNNYPYSADLGDVYYYTSNSTSDDIKYTSLSACTTAGHTEGECKHYHAGNYYNWTAAIASNNSSSLTAQYANAPNSICPKGWRLPVVANNDYGELLVRNNIISDYDSHSYLADGLNSIRKNPLYFVRSGIISGSALNSLSYGVYWYNTVANKENAYRFYFYSSGVYSASYDNANYKSSGWSVRCLAR